MDDHPSDDAETGVAKDDRQRRLFEFLDELAIAYVTHRHAPVFTVEEAQANREKIDGGHTKNLFLKDRKGNHFLLAAEENADIDLKSVHTKIGAKSRLSFARPDSMMAFLGVNPGSVTLLGVINDHDGRVNVVIDEPLLAHAVINLHPLSNDATTSISRDDLLRFLDATDHSPAVLKISA